MKIINVEQGTEEWHACRRLKMTASNAYQIKVNGKGLESYIKRIVMESACTQIMKPFSKEMEFGHEHEPNARDKYEMKTGELVDQVGFVEYSEFIGCSPDGLVGDYGLVEIKSRYNQMKQFDLLMSEDRVQYVKLKETQYYWQMQMQMLVCDRKWCDFVSYQPFMKDNIIIVRIERNERDIEILKLGLQSGERILKDYLKKYNSLKK